MRGERGSPLSLMYRAIALALQHLATRDCRATMATPAHQAQLPDVFTNTNFYILMKTDNVKMSNETYGPGKLTDMLKLLTR